MKKFLLVVLVIISVLTSACGKESAGNIIRVGASVTPHAEILEAAKEILAEEGYVLEIVEYNDYVLPNMAVESGEIDANFFQHQPYLSDFNAENGTNIVSVASVHYEPFGIYAGKTNSLGELSDGATVAIPNDGTNEARALFLLETKGLITLKEGTGFTATILDIESNPKNLDIKEIEAAQLPRTLEDVDIAVINGNYAIGAGLDVGDALAVEKKDSESAREYANILAVKKSDVENPAIQALVSALQSDEVREYIENTYDGGVVPIF